MPSPPGSNRVRAGLVFLVCLAVLGDFHTGAAEGIDAARYDTDAALAFDRAGFGHNDADLPVWSPLTNFETGVLKRRDGLQHGDIDAMLAFYLVASGDVRTRQAFLKIRSRFHAWTRQIRPRVEAVSKPEERAELLFREMHQHFFLKDSSSSGVPSGYDLNQSRLSTIFRTGKYNCISSAMLYILVSEAFGLRAHGVVLPSHAFVRLDFDNGDRIEVETTIPGGFNMVHDKAYFARAAKQLSRDLKLRPPTYEDYLHRAIVSPMQLGLVDMDSQHTSPANMPYRERMRIAEIRSTLDPHGLGAQLNRLYYYGREFNYLNRAQDYATMARLFQRIGPWLTSRSAVDFDSPAWQNALALVQVDMAYAWIRGHREAAGLKLSRRLLTSLSPGLDNYATLHEDLLSNLAQYVVETSAHREFTRARHALNGYERDCVHHANCATSLAVLYSRWIKVYWQNRDWRQVIRITREYLHLDHSSKNAHRFQRSLEAAFLNLASVYAFDEDHRGAKGVLTECVNTVKVADRCQAALRKLRAQGTL